MLSKKVDAAGVETWIAELAGDHEKKFDARSGAESWLHKEWADRATEAYHLGIEVELLHQAKVSDEHEFKIAQEIMGQRIRDLRNAVYMLVINGPLTLTAMKTEPPDGEYGDWVVVGSEKVCVDVEELQEGAAAWRRAEESGADERATTAREIEKARAELKTSLSSLVMHWLGKDRPAVLERGNAALWMSIHAELPKLPGFEFLHGPFKNGLALPEPFATRFRAAVARLYDLRTEAHERVARDLAAAGDEQLGLVAKIIANDEPAKARVARIAKKRPRRRKAG